MKLTAEEIRRDFFRNSKNTNIFTAVHETSFTLNEGEVTAITGRSGSGKTTFIHMLAGLLVPSAGKVYLEGRDLYSLDDTERSRLRNRCMGIIPQGQTGLAGMTALENVLVPVEMYRDGKPEVGHARGLLSALGIGELAEVYANELSGGELRRMAIARALIGNPDIIIADEPTGDLDDETTEMVLQLLKKQAEAGKSVLLVTHDSAVLPYADSVWKMEKGRLSRMDKTERQASDML